VQDSKSLAVGTDAGLDAVAQLHDMLPGHGGLEALRDEAEAEAEVPQVRYSGGTVVLE
jgi:hypothetical protein